MVEAHSEYSFSLRKFVFSPRPFQSFWPLSWNFIYSIRFSSCVFMNIKIKYIFGIIGKNKGELSPHVHTTLACARSELESRPNLNIGIIGVGHRGQSIIRELWLYAGFFSSFSLHFLSFFFVAFLLHRILLSLIVSSTLLFSFEQRIKYKWWPFVMLQLK